MGAGAGSLGRAKPQNLPGVDGRTSSGHNVAEGPSAIQVWLGSVKLHHKLPSAVALRELLYGDQGNTAAGADVIVLLLTGLSVKRNEVSRLRRLLRGCVDQPEDYVLNEDDKGLAIQGAPVQLVEVLEEANIYSGLYVAVHRRLVLAGHHFTGAFDFLPSAGAEVGTELANVFVTPPILACNAQTVGSKAEEYYAEKSIIMQDLVVRAPFAGKQTGPVHLLLCGANLSSNPHAQLRQIAQLERQLCVRRWGDACYTVLLVGDLGNRIVCGEDLQQYMNRLSPKAKKKKKDKKDKKGSDKKKEAKIEEEDDEDREASKQLHGEAAFTLSEAGAEEICRRLDNPVTRRQLMMSDSLRFTGPDCFGNVHERLLPCARELTRLFFLSSDWMLQRSAPRSRFESDSRITSKLTPRQAKLATAPATLPPEVPLPTCRRTSVEKLWSETLGFSVRMPEVVTKGMLRKGASSLHVPGQSPEELLESYLPSNEPQDKSHARVLKDKLGDALYLQMGWLDGIGVYRNSLGCKAELCSWQTQEDLLCFDHVPIKGSVRIQAEGLPVLRVWVGSIKLDTRFPSVSALRHFLYSSPEDSARDADVIALFLTDEDVNKQTVKRLQHLLSSVLGEDRDKYIFNEEEESLVIKGIPVQLVKASTGGKPRYVGLHICAKKELIATPEGCVKADVGDAFPQPPELICRSDMKNEASPSFKGHMAQTVMIQWPQRQRSLKLLVVGLNFDTEDGARERQVERLERYLRTFHREDVSFTAVIVGDFNGRMVCPSWLTEHVIWPGQGKLKLPVLSVAGAKIICSRLASPRQRLELLQTLDCWAFEGEDAAGNTVSVPSVCTRLAKLFQLHHDIVKEAPLPTYKRTPIGETLSMVAGFPLEVFEIVTREQLESGFRRLQSSNDAVLSDLMKVFFGEGREGDECEQRRIELPSVGDPDAAPQRSQRQPHSDTEEDVQVSPDDGSYIPPPPLLSCGWPDGVGVYRHGVLVRADLVAFSTCENIVGGLSHVPIRATVHIVPSAPSVPVRGRAPSSPTSSPLILGNAPTTLPPLKSMPSLPPAADEPSDERR